ncbi:MAG: hypothetical protein M0003_09950 [Acidithiobacillus sp.]|uniref:hypothetical protein n=1 Tax=Acidithiobacillus ferrooxidans TaxID=920 RepID=UPI000B233B04|nr:hypothetical protein [Acidithiobacillus ferrooxidans]MDA8153017.1 hypothetical protein [Acidithiobacillus sp.]
MSARSEFTKRIEGLSTVGIHMVIDQLKDQWSNDNSMNGAVRRFIEICEAEIEARYELITLPSEVAKRRAAIHEVTV